MRRVLPYPLLAASLLLMWLLLNGFTPGHLLLGSVVALAAARIMAALQPSKPQLRRWQLIPRLVFTVLADIARSNLAVADIVLRGRQADRRAGFIAIPLDLQDKTALAVLACIVTSTPGTAWVEYDTSSGVLLLHVLDLVEESHWIELVKDRYEAMLREIFE
jgi:multicomponent K+:H+ antiporter subunit E